MWQVRVNKTGTDAGDRGRDCRAALLHAQPAVCKLHMAAAPNNMAAALNNTCQVCIAASGVQLPSRDTCAVVLRTCAEQGALLPTCPSVS